MVQVIDDIDEYKIDKDIDIDNIDGYIDILKFEQ